jgi:hypothetical protein
MVAGLAEGVASNALWYIFLESVRRMLGREIRITSPRPQQGLTNPKPLGPGFSYEVRGTLKHLPKNHEIWLLVKEESSQRVWPQGFERVQYDGDDESWAGRINPAMSGPNVTIIAVVAPPTSQEFFQYFQRVGPETEYEPLERVPTECRNTDEVQAKKP